MNIEATHLGHQSNYPQQYDPSVLVAVPRQLNRDQYAIEANGLPFEGVDVWHAYEFSFLTQKGTPIVGVLKIVYPCNNPFLVESKSLKLYLNSFNMSRFGNTKSEGIPQITNTIETDLSNLLACNIEVNYFGHNTQTAPSDFDGFTVLEENATFDQLQFNSYTENPSLLKISEKTGEIKWVSHLLRSNCKITHQPDWGSIFIQMKGKKLPTPESFLQYIVSLRNENHFHEEICEMVFVRLLEKYDPKEMSVTCMYTRRGGIDINPVRVLSDTTLPKNIVQCSQLSKPAFRQ